MHRTLPKLAIAALLAAAPPAAAADGSAEAPTYGGAEVGELQPEPRREESSTEAQPAPKPRAKRRKRKRTARATGHPLLTDFSVGSSRVYLYGRAARVTFQINHRAKQVAVRLAVKSATTGQTVRTIDLGTRATGVPQSYRFTGREGGALGAGLYRIRVGARDAAGRGLVAAARTSAVDEIGVYPYVFPLRGNFSYGDPGSRFGAPRSGHTHQGQDVAAPEGTPLRAVRGGVVKTVAYQASGAGHYIVLSGAGQRRDYVYMHLQTGSIRVRQGQRVRTGAWIANVGNTGRSFGAHLHFEIWQGPWWGGGEPIDPYPLMRRWDRWS